MAVSGAAHLGAWRALIALSAALSAALAPASASAQSPRFDLVIRNGLVVDGNGAPPYRGDIAITGDRIARVAPRIDEAAVRVIDAGGKVLAPGFIDVHTHVRAGIFITPTADNYVYQGVTTLIEGPDGNSPVPLAPFFIRLEALAKTVNIGSFIGHGSVREAVIGRDDRRASSEELKRMRALVEQGMRDGAFGLSSGLIYVPGLFAPTEEIVELAKVAGRLGGHYQTHIRNESGHAVDAVREAIAIGEQAKIPVQITHHKLVGRRAWGMSVDTLREIDAARARGQDVTIDQYPYTGVGGNFFATLVPADLTAGGRKQLLRRLQDHAVRARLTAVIERKLRASGGRPYLDRVVISRCDFDESLAGQSIAELTRQRHSTVTVEKAAQSLVWIIESGSCERVVRDVVAPSDIERILRHAVTMVASDGEIPRGNSVPHPRSFGAFARVLSVYVREQRVLSLAQAVHKMTALPAQRLGLLDRGQIKQGMKADLVVFDPAQVRETATYDEPRTLAVGMSQVIVNGQIVLDGGQITAARPGRVVYGSARR